LSIIETEAQLRARYRAPGERAIKKQLDHLDRHHRRFIELSPFVMLATSDAQGRLDASPRGDRPGFVEVEDEQHLLLPDWPGNNRLDSLSNLLARPEIGMLFLVPGVDETLRVNGSAKLHADEGLIGRFERGGRRPATVLRVSVREAYLHCPKALMRSHLWDPEQRVERSILPTMGEMLREQTGLGQNETQAEALARYKRDLY
jgi:PPOX class probable FMN-dependent enzyme